MTDQDFEDDRGARRNSLEEFAAAGDRGGQSHELTIPQSAFAGGDRVVGAQQVAVYRDEAKIIAKIKALAAAAGDDWGYRFPVKSKDGSKSFIEGPSIKLANDLARMYGNCDVDTRVVDLGASWIFYARFTDFETGFSMTRPFQQRKGQKTSGKMDADRAQDIAFQIGTSKAIRNVVVNSLQTFADFAFEEARNSIVEKIGKSLERYRERVLGRLAELKVEPIRVERIIGRTAAEWLAPDIASIIATLKAATDGMATIEDSYPPLTEEGQPAKDAAPQIEKFAGGADAAAGKNGAAADKSAAAKETPAADKQEGHSSTLPAKAAGADAGVESAGSATTAAGGVATATPASTAAAAAGNGDKKLTAEQATKLVKYSERLMGAMSMNGLQKASAEFWDGDLPDESTQVGRILALIYDIHLTRVKDKNSSPGDTEKAVASLLGAS